MINAFNDADHMQMAIDFMKWWYLPDTQQQYLTRGGMPCDKATPASADGRGRHLDRSGDRPYLQALEREHEEGKSAMTDMVLWGFNGSTYVRTVKMLLAEKRFTDFEQVPTNVLAGEPKEPEHLARHPFGKVPVLDHDGMRILETSAIVRYLNDVLLGQSLVPATPKDRARMDMIIGLIDSYGYGALIGGVAAYHLFPDFVGGKNEDMRARGLKDGRTMLELAMQTRAGSPFIAGDLSLADLYLAPTAFYVSLTPDKDQLFGVDGFAAWWDAVQALDCFKSTPPQ